MNIFSHNLKDLLFDNRILFLFVVLVQASVEYIGDLTVFTEHFYVKLLTDAHYSALDIDSIRSFNLQMWWLFYLLNPVILLIKFVIITAFVFLIAYIRNISMPFDKILNLVILLELIFTIQSAVTIIWTGHVLSETDMFYYRSFSPLAAINLVNDLTLKQNLWLIFPLKQINLFQLTYIVLLSFLLAQQSNIKFSTGLGIVVSSYLVLLMFYVGGIMFAQIMAQPSIHHTYIHKADAEKLNYRVGET